MKSKKCDTPTCDNESYCTGLCVNCYSGIHYWMKRGVAAVMRRKTQLRILEERLDNLRPANVVHIRQRRRA